MNPTVPYLIHALRNAAKARDWEHLNLLLDELEEAVTVSQRDYDEVARLSHKFRNERNVARGWV